MPITPRENALKALNHQVPEYLPNLKFEANILPIYEILERGPSEGPHQPFGGGGYDWFGVKWQFVPTVGAPMVDPKEPHLFEEIGDWREKVKFPDLDAIDWEAAAKRDLSNPKYDPDKINQVMLLNGPFERMHAFMGVDNALCALLEDPEECYAYFGAIMDYKIKLIDKILEYYPVDLFDFHDDMGHQKNSFFSPQVYRDLLKDHYIRLTKHCKEKGVHLMWHSCGYIENLIPEAVDAGIEHWSSCQAINNIGKIASEFGDRLTILGGFDCAEYKVEGMTTEKLTELVGERIDQICPGGAVMPFGLSVIPGLSKAVNDAIAARPDFFQKPENRKLPDIH